MLEGNQKEKMQQIFMPQYLRRIGEVQQDEKRLATLRRETECINGIPQVVVKQPLTNEGENTEKGFSLAENLEYMIIGPTPHPHTIADALVWELEKYGIKEPWKRIKCTGIPLGA